MPPATPAADNTRAALTMVASMAFFAVEDLFLKRSAEALPPGQVLALTGATGACVFWALAAAVAALRRVDGGSLALRLAWCEDGSAPRAHSARKSALCGLALCAPGQPAYYLPLRHRYLGAPEPLAVEAALSALRPLFEDASVPKAVYGAKEAHQGLLALGVRLRGLRTDPALCSYLLDAAQDHGLEALVKAHLPSDFPPLPSRDALLQSGKHRVPFDQAEIPRAAELCGAEARAVLLLGEVLFAKLDAAGRTLLGELELPLSEVLAEMDRAKANGSWAFLRVGAPVPAQVGTLTRQDVLADLPRAQKHPTWSARRVGAPVSMD